MPISSRAHARSVDFYCRFLSAKLTIRFLLPISSRAHARRVDFYCPFLPFQIEEPISIADSFPPKSRSRFLLPTPSRQNRGLDFYYRCPISSPPLPLPLCALRSDSYRLSFTIIIHYSTHHDRKNSIICSWQLGAAHLCWRRILRCLHCDIMPPQPQSP